MKATDAIVLQNLPLLLRRHLGADTKVLLTYREGKGK